MGRQTHIHAHSEREEGGGGRGGAGRQTDRQTNRQTLVDRWSDTTKTASEQVRQQICICTGVCASPRQRGK